MARPKRIRTPDPQIFLVWCYSDLRRPSVNPKPTQKTDSPFSGAEGRDLEQSLGSSLSLSRLKARSLPIQKFLIVPNNGFISRQIGKLFDSKNFSLIRRKRHLNPLQQQWGRCLRFCHSDSQKLILDINASFEEGLSERPL